MNLFGVEDFRASNDCIAGEVRCIGVGFQWDRCSVRANSSSRQLALVVSKGLGTCMSLHARLALLDVFG